MVLVDTLVSVSAALRRAFEVEKTLVLCLLGVFSRDLEGAGGESTRPVHCSILAHPH
jgi:hypothetical protein